MSTTWPTISITEPDATAQSLTGMGQSTRDHLLHMRTALASGSMWGWDFVASGGTEEEPAVLLRSRGSERIRGTVTWGTVGGAIGNPAAILYEFSDDGGSTWATIGTCTFTWSAGGACTAVTWS